MLSTTCDHRDRRRTSWSPTPRRNRTHTRHTAPRRNRRTSYSSNMRRNSTRTTANPDPLTFRQKAKHDTRGSRINRLKTRRAGLNRGRTNGINYLADTLVC